MRSSFVLVAAVAAVTACAHTPDLGLRPESPAPAGEVVGSWKMADGTQLWQRHWLPTAPDGKERGVLIIMHGLVDHSDNYDRLARRANAAGYSVWAFDMRGHGRSSGPRVDPDSFEDYVDDLDKFIAQVSAAEPNQPVFVMGHSMGGAIVALTLVERQPKIAGAIISSAALNLGAPILAVAGARLAGVLAPKAPALKLGWRDFSQTPGVAETMMADPLVSHDPGPAHTVAELAAATSRIWAGTDKLTMPLLVLTGTDDKLVGASGSRALEQAAASTDKTLHVYDGDWHILMQEPNHAVVEGDILAWLDGHTGGAAVTAPPVDTQRAMQGDPKHGVQEVMIGGGIAHTSGDTQGLGELALRFAKFAPVGWAGAGTVRYYGDAGWDAALMPIGVSIRPGPVAIGIAGGIGTLGPGAHLSIPATAWLELPLGPIHVTASAQLDYLVRGSPARDAPLSSDLSWFGVAIRAPGDVKYWPGTRAGVGPYVQAGALTAESTTGFQITAGLELYGAD